MSDPQLTIDQVEDLEEVLRVFRRRRPLLIIGGLLVAVAIAVSSFGLAFSARSAMQVQALSDQVNAINAASQAQQRQFQGFLQRFVAEENYVCSVEAAEAVRDGLMPPPKSVCAVALPTTRPQPPATPKPAPSAAPAPVRPTAAPTASARPTAAPMPTPTASAVPRPCLLQVICVLAPGCVHSGRHPHCG